MIQLPIPGQSDGNWGEQLNDFLLVSHNVDGTINSYAFDNQGREYYLESFGGGPDKTRGENDNALAEITGQLSMTGGIIRLSPGRWHINLDLSNLSDVGITVAGSGLRSTTLWNDDGNVVNVYGSSRIILRDFTIEGVRGAKVGLLAGRSGSMTQGYRLLCEQIRTSGFFSVAGLYDMAEYGLFIDCQFRNSADNAPCAFVSGRDDKNYVTDSAALSMVMTRFVMSTFMKDKYRLPKENNDRLESGPAFELGSSVSNIVFEQCYFHATNNTPVDTEEDNHLSSETLFLRNGKGILFVDAIRA
ncbi:hypothetical protein KFU94_30805 [Chloroflexi bacterium TSY]|nr:hypothetical protein [Chloroflexi bacterium TSY]